MNLFDYESISVIWANTPRIAFNVLCDFFMILRNSKESMSPSSSSEFWCARNKSMLTAPLTELPPSSSKELSSSFATEISS